MRSTTKIEKLYPFSTAKYAHSIEYYAYSLQNRLYDLDPESEEYWELMDKITEVNELRKVMSGACGRPVWFTGKQIALAKRCIGWADNARAQKAM